jgi:hypothetical protein
MENLGLLHMNQEGNHRRVWWCSHFSPKVHMTHRPGCFFYWTLLDPWVQKKKKPTFFKIVKNEFRGSKVGHIDVEPDYLYMCF